ncbi:hypothetical protein C0J52_20097 [Blattella germanica]|nr:hypothetical protein C0J52_20097 [Blattella germanica]
MTDYVELENFLDNINVKIDLNEHERLVQNDEYADRIRNLMARNKSETGEYHYPLQEERNHIFTELTKENKHEFHWNTANTLVLIRVREDFEEEFQKLKSSKKRIWQAVSERISEKCGVTPEECYQ